jgi:peptidoglycan DL-endopeptidase CwlO
MSEHSTRMRSIERHRTGPAPAPARDRLATRPLTWSIVACTAFCLLVPRPGYGDPGNNTVPDPGATPVTSAPVQVPGSGPTTPAIAPVAGPLGTRIMAESAAVEALGERLKQAQIDAAAAHDATVATQQAWQQAQSTAADLRERADNAAAEAYKKAESLGPLGQYAETMHDLGVLAPGFGDGTPGGIAGSQTAAQDAARAEKLAQTAYAAYQSALATELQKNQDRDRLASSYAQRSAALANLKSHNTEAVAQAEAAQEAADQQLASQFAAGSNVDGMVANPIAIKALHFALSQRGKPYVWGAEGPDSYDCSGLTWRSYHEAGVNIPRVAKDQYRGTAVVDVSKLLPGDLVFFSTTSRTDWTTISHVGMYLGDNMMIEAPTTGDVVKIATVWWSAFFGATRVVPAVPGPKPKPTSPSPSPSPSRSPSPSPSRSPSPSPSSSSTSSSPPPSSPPPSNTPASPAVPGESTTPSTTAPSTTESTSASPSVSTSASG